MIEMKDIDGEPHVIVPKNIWDRMWDLFIAIHHFQNIALTEMIK